MTRRRQKTSPVLTEQVAGNALAGIIKSDGRRPLPQARPSLREIPLANVLAGSDLQTRAPFDPDRDPDDAELLDSIRQVGVRLPVHLQDMGDKTYGMRSGHRRVSAARLAGLQAIPAIVWPVGADAFDSALDTWLENLHRKDLAPLERSKMLGLVLERFELASSAETARSLGLSKTSFYRYLSLLKAPDDVKAALGEEKLGVAQAEKVIGIEDPQMRRTMLHAIEHGASAKQIDAALEAHRSGKPIPASLLRTGSGAEARQGGGRLPAKGRGWPGSKISRLCEALKLDPVEIDPIARSLRARRISAAHASVAALLAADGEPGESALEATAPLNRSVLRALDVLFNAVVEDGTNQVGGEILGRALGQLLALIG